ncbi:MAG: bifunctional demethylmenaquinone methyltransferase/2-methoxy-6-polyprenyl-1,4-benzoquinol methylase UbiE [Bacteroidota bacterium]|nr:bifunctional demethylmenaquinone methyltransferase/2-methoxy-6-polyprenyl-1,4-benzoquinol methylase UbiE [Bacteroidota bacterium]
MAKPYKNQQTGKKEQVALMFNNIAQRYDFLNHLLSLGIDKIWRKKAIKRLSDIKQNPILLDIACGTGDLAIEALKLNPQKIIGIDISSEMLKIGQHKIKQKKCSHIIQLQKGDAENIPFDDNFFDGITVAFGVRNFENLSKGLIEMLRVLKPGGNVVILEFSKPTLFPVKQIYQFYFNVILPVIGKFFSKDHSAYTYLPESVKCFPEQGQFIKEMEKAGFSQSNYKSLTFGIATIYYAKKNEK